MSLLNVACMTHKSYFYHDRTDIHQYTKQRHGTAYAEFCTTMKDEAKLSTKAISANSPLLANQKRLYSCRYKLQFSNIR